MTLSRLESLIRCLQRLAVRVIIHRLPRLSHKDFPCIRAIPSVFGIETGSEGNIFTTRRHNTGNLVISHFPSLAALSNVIRAHVAIFMSLASDAPRISFNSSSDIGRFRCLSLTMPAFCPKPARLVNTKRIPPWR